MNDTISRIRLLKRLKDRRNAFCENRIQFLELSKNDKARVDEMDMCIAEVINAPTIEQEIIACADCKHWICHDRRCGYWNHGVKPLDWCSYAERRTDG